MSRSCRRRQRGPVALGGLALVCLVGATHPRFSLSLLAIAGVAGGLLVWHRRARRSRLLTYRGEPTVLYRHYDPTGRLLYVGITNDYRRRCAQHADDKPWWQLVDPGRSTCQTWPNRAAAELAEVEAIRSERPVFNIAHNERALRRPAYGRFGCT